MPRFARLLVALLALSGLTFLRESSAHEDFPPKRPLTPTERLDYTIGVSDAVLLGRVISQDNNEQSVEVLPIQWFKGGNGSSPIWVGFYSSAVGESHKDWDRLPKYPALFFLWNLRPPTGPHVEYPNRDDWAAVQGSSAVLGNGVEVYDSTWIPSVEREIAQAVKRSSPDSLALRSDLVVIGQDLGAKSRVERTVYGAPGRCLLLGIEKTLLGSEARQSVPIYSVIGGWMPGRSVFFLKAMPDSVYELMSRVNQIAIVGDSLRTGGTLSDFEKRFKHLRKEWSKRRQ